MTNNGILLVDKPAGISSAAAVARLKKAHRLDKLGHGGTLDPFATGLLVLLVGEATKISRFFLGGEKEYEAEAAIGTRTDTGDRTGRPVAESQIRPEAAAWEKTRPAFTGKILQTPPAYSAIKRAGKPLYEYARAGETVALEPRPIEIHSLEILAAEPEKLRFRVRCGGGTYIRVLAENWAEATGTYAYLAELRRTESCGFRVSRAKPLAELEKGALEIVPIAEALAWLPRLECPADVIQKVRLGQWESLQSFAGGLAADPLAREGVLLFSAGASEPAALLRWNPERNRLEIERAFLL